MADFNQIYRAIGVLQAESINATKERERLHNQLAEISQSVRHVQTSLDKLCAARSVERRIAAKIAGVVAFVFSAASAVATKYWVN